MIALMMFSNHLGGSAFSLYPSPDCLKSYVEYIDNIVTLINGERKI